MVRTTVILLLCFILAQADKQVIGLIALPVQAHFGLNNSELGFLQGGAFAVAFAIGGLPISSLVDRYHRVRLAAFCVALWSIATILCGLAASFTMLLLCRAATAVAEAGLPPAAFSIFSQQKDSRSVARLTGTFMLAPFIGTGGMFVLGGWLLGAAHQGRLTLPAGWEPWRTLFLVVGIAGLLLAPLLALLGREPARALSARRGEAAIGYRGVLRHIFVERRFLRYYYLAIASFYLSTASLLAWYPALLVRHMGIGIGKAGLYAGLTYLAGGMAGTLATTAYFSSRKGLGPTMIIRGFLFAAAALAPITLIVALAPSLLPSVAAYGLFAIVSAGVLAIMPVPIQLGLAEDVRARGTAIVSLLMSAIAGTIGPLTVGLLMDFTGMALASALATTMLTSSLLSIWLFSRATSAGYREAETSGHVNTSGDIGSANLKEAA